MTWRMLAPLPSRAVGREVDPFLTMRRELDRVFDDVWRGLPLAADGSHAGSVPLRLDVKEDDKAFYVAADLPGMSEKDVEITFEDGVLTIRGEKKITRDEKQDTWHLVERSYGSFARQIALPKNVDANAINAEFEHGVLHVTLPKKADDQAKARRIEIKAR